MGYFILYNDINKKILKQKQQIISINEKFLYKVA